VPHLTVSAIESSEITSRRLDIAIQSGVASSTQLAALEQVVAYGAQEGVVVRIVSIP
jgi:hypothetical protein